MYLHCLYLIYYRGIVLVSLCFECMKLPICSLGVQLHNALRKLAELESCHIYVDGKEVPAKTQKVHSGCVCMIQLTEKIPEPEILPRM